MDKPVVEPKKLRAKIRSMAEVRGCPFRGARRFLGAVQGSDRFSISAGTRYSKMEQRATRRDTDISKGHVRSWLLV